MKKINRRSFITACAAVAGAAALTACGGSGSGSSSGKGGSGKMTKLFTTGTSRYMDSIAWYASDVYSLVINSDDTYELTYQMHIFGTTDPGLKALRTIIYTGTCTSAPVEGETAQITYTLAVPTRIYMEQHEKGVGRSAIAGTIIIDTDNWNDAMTLAYDPDTNSKKAEDFLAQFGEEITIEVEDPTLVPEDTTLSSKILQAPELALVSYLG